MVLVELLKVEKQKKCTGAAQSGIFLSYIYAPSSKINGLQQNCLFINTEADNTTTPRLYSRHCVPVGDMSKTWI